jgi:hypothetical protein
MAQLVGRRCVRCRQQIGWIGDSQFCTICGRPVHNACAKPGEAPGESCPACGAPGRPARRRRGATTAPIRVGLPWWQFGLIGGGFLSLPTVGNVIIAVAGGEAHGVHWGEIAAFAAIIFAMGFVSGLVVWAGRGLYRRFGVAGTALVGVAVMVIYFLACMLLFEPAMLGSKFSSAGLPMFVLAALFGLVVGGTIGFALRSVHNSGDST